jgi:hypothetical protein
MFENLVKFIVMGCWFNCEAPPEKHAEQVVMQQPAPSDGEVKARYWLSIFLRDNQNGVPVSLSMHMVQEGLKNSGLTISDIATKDEAYLFLKEEGRLTASLDK